ncbi:hypothetical protein BB560_003464, partial [Smittium megazygosporum]
MSFQLFHIGNWVHIWFLLTFPSLVESLWIEIPIDHTNKVLFQKRQMKSTRGYSIWIFSSGVFVVLGILAIISGRYYGRRNAPQMQYFIPAINRNVSKEHVLNHQNLDKYKVLQLSDVIKEMQPHNKDGNEEQNTTTQYECTFCLSEISPDDEVRLIPCNFNPVPDTVLNIKALFVYTLVATYSNNQYFHFM